ncbi:MAG: twin-arginine translocase subunit TatC [Acidimicrobiia bacterium]
MTTETSTRMSLVAHLTELRRRLTVCLVAVAAGAVIVYVFFGDLLRFISTPYRAIDPTTKLIATGVADQFLLRLTVATYGGIIIAMPVILWELWRFITPGLNPKEKRYSIPFLLSSVVLFTAGAAVGWFTLEPALKFLYGAGGGEIQQLNTAKNYVNFVVLIFLAFGLSFEFPIVLMFLLIARVVSTAQLRKGRRLAIVLIAVFAAVITPSQDPYSLLFMAAPMYLFFESTIVIGRIMKR